MTLRNVPSFDGPHAQTSHLHQVGDSFLSVFPSVGRAILDASLVWTRWAANGRGQIRHVATTRVLIDSIIVNTEWARTRALCPRVNADAVVLKTRKRNEPFPRTAGLRRPGRITLSGTLAVGGEGPVGGSLVATSHRRLRPRGRLTQVLVVFPPLYLFFYRLVANQLRTCHTTEFDSIWLDLNFHLLRMSQLHSCLFRFCRSWVSAISLQLCFNVGCWSLAIAK